MASCPAITDCVVAIDETELYKQEYREILSEASIVLSPEEFRHLADVADVGYTHTTQKGEYLEHLSDTVSDWIAETKRAKLYCLHHTLEIDYENWYNAPKEVEKQMMPNQEYKVIPTFYVCFGAVTLALFCIFATLFVLGMFTRFFVINPVYLLMFAIGFLGLFATDIAAIIEWRKAKNE